MKNKILFLITSISLIFLINIVFAQIQTGTSGQIGVDLNIPTVINYSTVNVNNSQYLQGYTPTTLRTWLQSFFDTIYSSITEPLWTSNFTKYNSTWSSTTNLSYVPYTGAISNVNLGSYNLTVPYINGVNISNLSNIYLLKTGDTATGDYNFDSGTLFIDSASNRVGIGTVTPRKELSVIGKINIGGAEDSGLDAYDLVDKGLGAGLFLWRNGNGYEPFILLRSGAGAGAYGGQVRGLPYNQGLRFTNMLSDVEYMRIQDGDLIVDTDTLVVKSSANRVGIGTANPQNTLNVIGATNSTTGFIVGANTGLTGNYSIGGCNQAFAGGILYWTNCSIVS